MSPSLPFSLSEEFFLLAHDDTSGKPLMSTDVLGLGLAAALLAQLLPDARIVITPEGGVLLRRFEATGRSATDDVVKKINDANASRPGALYPIDDWLRYLREVAYASVADSLVRARVVYERSSLRSKRYVAPNILDAASSRTGLVYLCRNPPARPDDSHEQPFTLAGLVLATNMTRVLNSITGVDLSEQMSAFVRWLPRDTRAVLDALELAVQSRVQAPRGR